MLSDRELVASLETDVTRMNVVKARLASVVTHIDSLMAKHRYVTTKVYCIDGYCRRVQNVMRRTVWHWMSPVYTPAELVAMNPVTEVADERLLDIMAVHAKECQRRTTKERA